MTVDGVDDDINGVLYGFCLDVVDAGSPLLLLMYEDE